MLVFTYFVNCNLIVIKTQYQQQNQTPPPPKKKTLNQRIDITQVNDHVVQWLFYSHFKQILES